MSIREIPGDWICPVHGRTKSVDGQGFCALLSRSTDGPCMRPTTFEETPPPMTRHHHDDGDRAYDHFRDEHEHQLTGDPGQMRCTGPRCNRFFVRLPGKPGEWLDYWTGLHRLQAALDAYMSEEASRD